MLILDPGCHAARDVCVCVCVCERETVVSLMKVYWSPHSPQKPCLSGITYIYIHSPHTTHTALGNTIPAQKSLPLAPISLI